MFTDIRAAALANR